MVVFELVGTEQNPVYQALEIENGNRQYDFLKSIIETSVQINRTNLSHELIKALNYHAIACLHVSAGEYRPCRVTVGNHVPVEHWQVPTQMNMFIDEVNRAWENTDTVTLAAYVLWKLNHVHPFINGNGRTARATAYFVLCAKAGGWMAGQPILPDLIKANHADYVLALQAADASLPTGQIDLRPLHDLLTKLLAQQMAGAVQVTP